MQYRLLLLLCILVGICSPLAAQAAMTLGAAYVGVNGGSGANSLTYNGLTSGRGLVVMILWQDGAATTITSVAATSESNLTLIGTPSRNATTGWSSQIAYLGTISTTGNKTITTTFSDTVIGSYVFAQELYDSVAGGIALDGFANTNGGTANPTVDVTTGSNNSAILAVLENSTGAPTAGSGYTAQGTAWFNAEYWEYDLDVGTAGTYAANWTVASSNWSLAAAGFKAAGGAVAETFGFRRRLQVQP